MKTIFLALALITGTVQAAQDSDSSPCDAVADGEQTLECSVYSKDAAEQLLNENYQALLERTKAQYGGDKAQLADINNKLKVAQQAWLKLRDADCAVEAFPATVGSKAFTISQNDCIARMSDERSEFLESVAQE